MEGNIADIRCPNCGAPAAYDIVRGNYHCAHCGGRVELSEAQAQRRGFRSLQQEKIRESAGKYRLMRANCTGCGAELVFEENEALTNCSFCGRSLVRSEYASSEELPEMIIPFGITRRDAEQRLLDWCGKNAGREESKNLRSGIGSLQGCYLPYELIRGPVSCRVSRMDTARTYRCGGYVDNVFVNATRQLDNLLLDAMEPFDLDALEPFDFAYAAGQQIRVRDTGDEELRTRVSGEISEHYAPVVRRTLETKAVDVFTDTDSVLRMPVLLPVYYIRAGETLAAVNGQTGKVSVRADKESHFYFLPWWLKAILATLLISAGAFGAFRLFGMDPGTIPSVVGVLAAVILIVSLCVFSETVQNRFRVESGRKIFTSPDSLGRRKGKTPVRERRAGTDGSEGPVFFVTLDGKERPARLVFSSLGRQARTIAVALLVMFLPVIIALFLNGFDFGRLELGGSAVWFCIAVPIIPIYLLKFDIVQRYERPWIYLISEDGSEKRWREKHRIRIGKEERRMILRALFVPPVSLGVWFGILAFFVMCYLTAFGFD